MEEAVSTCTDSLIAIYTTRAKYTDRWLVGFHIVSLVARSVAAEEDVLGDIVRVALLDEEGILHVTSWVIGCKVEHGEHVLVVIYLRTMIQGEAHAREDVDNLVLDNCQRMASTQSHWVRGTGQVEVVVRILSLFHLLLQRIDALGGRLLQLIDFHTNGFLLVGSYRAEVVHERIDLALLAQILDAKLLHFLCILCRKCAYFLQ